MKGGYRIAADIGGTFTDIALVTERGTIATWKILSTPGDYSQAVIDGISSLVGELGIPVDEISEVIHGCTVATNAVLENKGAKTALLTTKGFRDVLELRRIRMPRLYDLTWIKPEPLVPRRLRFEITERMSAQGEVVLPVESTDVYAAIERIKGSGVEAVAVCFINSFANPAHEHIVGEMLRNTLQSCFVTLSTEVLPEIREYERTSTTVINAFLGPPVGRYIESLIDGLHRVGVNGRLMVMQSGGGVLEATTVLQRPAEIVECGPAAGVIGAAYLGERNGYRDIITFDMGGTTAKASIIEGGRILKTDEYEVGGGISLSSRLVKGGGYALKLPVIDISEVGAGGGSIVWFDKAGVLKVGPQSAGADPGPACYSLGGRAPTVTDANVVLGYINPGALANGTVPIDAGKAEDVIYNQVAATMKTDLLESAYGIHTVVNASMARAIKAVSTYRGRDPRDFALFAFGGNGGVHACQLASSLGIRRVVVPPAAGVFSALGLLFAKAEITRSRALIRRTERLSLEDLEEVFSLLEKEILSALCLKRGEVGFQYFADVRYAGQAYELTIPVHWRESPPTMLGRLERDFEDEHEKTYGHRFPRQAKETVSVRVLGSPGIGAERGEIPFSQRIVLNRKDGWEENRRSAYFGPELGLAETWVVSNRAALSSTPTPGPVIIEEYEGTVVVDPQSQVRLDEWGSLLIDVHVPEGG